MGGCCSRCCPSPDEVNATGQFESLVIPKPSPVDIVEVLPESSNSDIPLFAPAQSDDDNVEISDIEIIPDSDEENNSEEK
ncbi:hypothetical protein TRFO_30194 [Tritrichomonas foetus]|uniref:Uncharacterized protein n=1 Tax=Tritrichomonas foetus TaxID=1144522 RepID=A0A1J4JW40_9EUKA|nr:hypothetical protein TRFO_30194 [Tritrichomonas foetus]|eukprot:OHT02656.1 hypothetical protein TRFO_30194 [Tritrichomonas foetus]